MANNKAENFFVITGGPGSGKSSLIEALVKRGYACSIEAGRGVIQDQMAIGGRALPWDDRPLFAELMLACEMSNYRVAQKSVGPVFFDRGIPDVLGYLHLLNLPIPAHMKRAAEVFRYHRKVFLAPPWQEIFQNDNERKQDFDEAVRTYEAMIQSYTAQGYELVELSRASVDDRADFVLDYLQLKASS
jgi:predicted ATPase